MIKSGKKTTLSLLVCGLVVAAQAQAAPAFYGKLSMSLDNSRDANGDNLWHLDNQASRLGVKGKVDLDNGLEAVYQYEVGMDPSTSKTPLFGLRNSFAGLEGSFGQLIGGTFDTPFKQAQGKVDQFNDTRLDVTSYLAGEVRHDQSVQYTTPKLPGGLVATVDWMPAQTAADDDGVSASVGIKQDRFEAALAMEQKVAGDGGIVTAKANPLDAARVMLSFAPSDSVKLGLMAQQAEGVDADKSREKGWMASAAWTLDRLTLKGQVGQGLADKDAAGNSSDAKQEQLALGVDYKLAKSVKAFSYAGMMRNSDGAAGTAVGETRKDYSVGVGMSLDF
jgi:predicted porin